MGDVSTKTVSFKKLSGKDLENKKIRKSGSCIDFCSKNRVIYDRRININSKLFPPQAKKIKFW